MKWEKEFFRLAAFMLLSRNAIFQGKSLHPKWHAKPPQKHLEISLLGYTDTVLEMKMLLKVHRHPSF